MLDQQQKRCASTNAFSRWMVNSVTSLSRLVRASLLNERGGRTQSRLDQKLFTVVVVTGVSRLDSRARPLFGVTISLSSACGKRADKLRYSRQISAYESGPSTRRISSLT